MRTILHRFHLWMIARRRQIRRGLRRSISRSQHILLRAAEETMEVGKFSFLEQPGSGDSVKPTSAGVFPEYK